MPFLISIIMPAYNAQQFISKAIESVIAQTYTNWELIVVDDGSIDSTADRIKEYEKRDARIKYYYQTNNKQASARNLGIKYSKGEWIGFLDADDSWKVDKLEIQNNYIKLGVADIYFTGGYVIDEKDNFLSDYKTISGKFSGNEMYKILYKWNPIPILSTLINANWITKAGSQDEDKYIAQSCEDWDYWIRLSKLDAIFFGIDDTLFLYREHAAGTSRDLIRMELGQALVLIKNFDKYRFNSTETRKIFKPFVVPLLINLVKNKKKKEAFELMEKLFSKIPIFSYKINYILFKVLKEYSFYPIRAINKIDTIINGK